MKSFLDIQTALYSQANMKNKLHVMNQKTYYAFQTVCYMKVFDYPKNE